MSVDALIAADPDALDNVGLKATLLELGRVRARLDAFEARVIGVFDARGVFVDDGMVTTKAWLAHHTLIPRAVAGGRVLLAKRLRRMPLMADALAAGAVAEGHARALGRCLTPRTVAAFARDEAMLVAKATTLEVDEYESTIADWLRRNDVDGPDPGDGRPSHLRTSPMLYGRTRIDGELELEDSAEFLAELDELYEEQWQIEQSADLDDPIRLRSHAERNAAALVEMARRSSAAGDRDRDQEESGSKARPRRPQLLTIVDVPALAGDPNGHAELEDGRLLALTVLERWACDCSLGRVVMAGRSVPIDLGQVTYTPSTGQRRALIARDRGCIVPGCKRKARWCEAHHVNPWPNGPTDLSNLALLCGRHHKQVHAKRIVLVNDPAGGWQVRRPDGTPLLRRPPPTLAA